MLPGLFGRDPWKNADITAFGYIVNIAQGRTSWLAPTVGGIPADGSLLPYWIGALFVKLSSPWLDPAFAARIPFALLLGLALALTWYATYHLARAESAQPLPFAFGGEAEPIDYARAIADGALLALIASLGLLQLGHETTPELVQLVGLALFLYGLAASPHKPVQGGLATALALVALAASGAPTIAMLLAGVAVAVTLRRPWRESGSALAWIGAGTLLAAGAATALGAWANRLGAPPHPAQLLVLARAIAWFAWPAWLLALWTLVAVAPAPLGPARDRAAGVRGDAARRLDRDGRQRPCPDAGAARARHPGRVRAADARARRRRGDRLVLGLLLHHRGRRRLALLRRDPDRHAGQAGGQRRPALARLQP